MANDKVKIEINAVDNATPVVKGLKENLEQSLKGCETATEKLDKSSEGLWKQFATGGVAAGLINQGIEKLKQSVEECFNKFLEADRISTQFENTLTTFGRNSAVVNDDLRDFADRMSVLTNVEDNAILSLESYAMNLGLTTEETKRAVQGAIGLSKVYGMDLNSSVKAISMAMEGNYSLLQRHIVALRDETDASKQAKIFNESLANSFGIAVDNADSASGSFDRFKLSVEKLKEEFGEALANTIIPLLKQVADLLDNIIVKAAIKAIGFISKAMTELLLGPGGGFIERAIEEEKRRLAQEERDRAKSLSDYETWKAKWKKISDQKAKDDKDFYDDQNKQVEEVKETNEDLLNKQLRAQREYAEKKKKLLLEEIKLQREMSYEMLRELNRGWEEEKKFFNDKYSKGVNEQGAFTEMETVGNNYSVSKYSPLSMNFVEAIKRQIVELSTVMDVPMDVLLEKGIAAICIEGKGKGNFTPEKFLKDNMQQMQADAKAFVDVWGPIGDAVLRVMDSVSKLKDQMVELGIVGEEEGAALDNVFGKVGTEISSTIGAMTSIASGDIVGALTDAMDEMVNRFQMVLDIYEMIKSKKDKESIKLDFGWAKLSPELADKLLEQKKLYGDTKVAFDMMIGDIIAGTDVSTKNFDKYAKSVENVVTYFKQGKISGKEFQEAVGKGFGALVDKMNELKMPGITKGMKDIIEAVRDSGTKVKEVSDFIMKSLEGGIDALIGYYKGIKGQEQFNRGLDYTMALVTALQKEGLSWAEIEAKMGSQLDELLKMNFKAGPGTAISDILGMRQFAKDQPELVGQLDSVTKLMKSLGDSVYMNKDLFAEFGADTIDIYTRMIEKGQSEERTLMMMAPLLAEQLWYSKQYGFALDAQTKALIDKATAQGINLEGMKTEKQLWSEMNDSMGRMCDILERAFPAAAMSAGEAWANLANTMANTYIPELPTGTGGRKGKNDYDEYAAEGWQGWVNKRTSFMVGEPGSSDPEYVSITPMSKMGRQRGDGAPGGKSFGPISLAFHTQFILDGSRIDERVLAEKMDRVYEMGISTITKKIKGL